MKRELQNRYKCRESHKENEVLIQSLSQSQNRGKVRRWVWRRHRRSGSHWGQGRDQSRSRCLDWPLGQRRDGHQGMHWDGHLVQVWGWNWGQQQFQHHGCCWGWHLDRWHADMLREWKMAGVKLSWNGNFIKSNISFKILSKTNLNTKIKNLSFHLRI